MAYLPPDIGDIDCIDEAHITNYIYAGNMAGDYASGGVTGNKLSADRNPQFLVDPNNGLHYLRCGALSPPQPVSDGSYSRIISWAWKFGYPGPLVSYTEAYCRWCLWIEDDVIDGMNELGVKLPGFSYTSPLSTDETLSLRMEHGQPDPVVRGQFPFVSYWYDGDSGQGFGEILSMNSNMYSGRWHCVEQYIKLNTPGVADGVGTIWLDDVPVWHSDTKNWRRTSRGVLDYMHVNIYHGGLNSPKAPIHYRIARIAASTTRIGMPAELQTTAPPAKAKDDFYSNISHGNIAGGRTIADQNQFPLWRRNISLDNTFRPIASTGLNMNNLSLDGTNGVNGFDAGHVGYIVDIWNGFAASKKALYTTLSSGHDQGGQTGYQNFTGWIDLSQDSPQWALLHPGTPLSVLTKGGTQSYTVGLGFPYYYDGLPCARHTYNSTCYNPITNQIMIFGSYAAAGMNYGFTGGPQFDVFDLATNTWAAAGTYPNIPGPFFSGVQSQCIDPTTGNCYWAANQLFYKWTRATNVWTQINPSGVPGEFLYFQFKSSVIDVNRNAWVNLRTNQYDSTDSRITFIDLTTSVARNVKITGPLATEGILTYSRFVHDLDNDRYVYFGANYSVPGTPVQANVYAIDPTTGVSTVITTVENAANGVQSRLNYHQDLGGITYQPKFANNLLFMATR